MEDDCHCYLRYRHTPPKAVKSCHLDSVEGWRRAGQSETGNNMLLSFFSRGIRTQNDGYLMFRIQLRQPMSTFDKRPIARPSRFHSQANTIFQPPEGPRLLLGG